MTEVKVYKFKMGSGGPHRYIGFWSPPSRGLAETNPEGYYRAMQMKPTWARFACDHCGTPIENHHGVADKDGNKFCVGSDCIRSLGESKISTQAKERRLAHERKLRRARREKKREEERQAREAALEEERQRNGGLTDWEVAEQVKQAIEDAARSRRETAAEEVLWILDLADTDFTRSIARDIRRGRMPHGRGKSIVLDIMAKHMSSGARRNAKAYDAALATAEDIYDRTEKKLEAIQ